MFGGIPFDVEFADVHPGVAHKHASGLGAVTATAFDSDNLLQGWRDTADAAVFKRAVVKFLENWQKFSWNMPRHPRCTALQDTTVDQIESWLSKTGIEEYRWLKKEVS